MLQRAHQDIFFSLSYILAVFRNIAMPSSSNIPDIESGALEDGFAPVQDAQRNFEMTTVQTGSTAVATSPTISPSKTVYGELSFLPSAAWT